MSACQNSPMNIIANHSFLDILYLGWLFGKLNLWRLTISPKILGEMINIKKTHQRVNLPKIPPMHKMTKMLWLFGSWPFLLVSKSFINKMFMKLTIGKDIIPSIQWWWLTIWNEFGTSLHDTVGAHMMPGYSLSHIYEQTWRETLTTTILVSWLEMKVLDVHESCWLQFEVTELPTNTRGITTKLTKKPALLLSTHLASWC